MKETIKVKIENLVDNLNLSLQDGENSLYTRTVSYSIIYPNTKEIPLHVFSKLSSYLRGLLKVTNLQDEFPYLKSKIKSLLKDKIFKREPLNLFADECREILTELKAEYGQGEKDHFSMSLSQYFVSFFGASKVALEYQVNNNNNNNNLKNQVNDQMKPYEP